MAQGRTESRLVRWRVLVLVGAVGNGVGLIGGMPVITLLAAPLLIVGVTGLMTSRRRQRS